MPLLRNWHKKRNKFEFYIESFDSPIAKLNWWNRKKVAKRDITSHRDDLYNQRVI